MLMLMFIIGIWCVIHYILKKFISLCIKLANLPKSRKFFTRIRVLLRIPASPRRVNDRNEIPILIIPENGIDRPSSPPPLYDLPPSYENLQKMPPKESTSNV